MFTKTLEDVTETLIDYRGKTPPKTSCGVKLITAKIIKDGFVQSSNLEYISEEIYEAWMRRGIPKQWDILITTEAPLGEVAQLRTTEKIALAQRVILLRGIPQVIDQQYYFQALKSPFVQAGLQMRATGTTVAGIKQSELRQVEIPLPPLPTQRKIAAILSAYDDLIENNTRRIKILEDLAATIYREWFVEFRFPGHQNVPMIESELGLIPQVWEIKQLGDMCHVLMGQSPKSEFYNETGEGLPFHQGVTDFGNRFPIDRVYCTVENRIAKARDILFSVRAPVGRINLANKKVVIGRGLSAIRSKSGNQAFIFQQMQDKFQEENTMGSGTIFNAITKGDLLGIQLLKPAKSVIADFEEIVQPIFSQVANLTLKNTNLRQTRDLFLPKLISGEIDVSELDINTEGI